RRPHNHLVALSFASRSSVRRPPPPSFPTRRSSDLEVYRIAACGHARARWPASAGVRVASLSATSSQAMPVAPGTWVIAAVTAPRSEEHTSELQSRENLVCRLLLEKKQQMQRS